jgi:GWxTD domain-containing protein
VTRRGVLMLALLAVGTVGGCRPAGPRPLNSPDVPSSVRAWAEGPVRWLFQPDERRRFQRVRTSPQALAFIEAFWRRRDPDLEEPGNPYAEEFFRRTQEADLLYEEDHLVGSLTDRGRVFILLGPPSRLSLTQRAAPALGSTGRRGRGDSTTKVSVEVWGYVALDLGEELWAKLTAADPRVTRLELAFVNENRRTRLTSGEELLEIAAAAGVRRE